MIDALIYECDYKVNAGERCALIANNIILSPNDEWITVENKMVTREKVVDALKDAVAVGGEIYIVLNPYVPSSVPSSLPSGTPFFVPSSLPSESMVPTTQSPSISEYPSLSPTIVQEIEIEFSFDSTVYGQINIEQSLQSVTETVVQEAISCAGLSTDCISYNFSVVIESFFFECFDDQPLGVRCVLIDDSITLFPINAVITVEDKELARIKVVNSLKIAAEEGGSFYNILNPSAPSVFPSLGPTGIPSSLPSSSPSRSLRPTLVPTESPSISFPPSFNPTIVQEIEIIFTYDAAISVQFNVDQSLQLTTETIVEEAIDCVGLSIDCISYTSTLIIDNFNFECLDDQPPGVNCVLIYNTIILSPIDVESSITEEDKEVATQKVVDSLQIAVAEDGAIYNVLNQLI